MMKNARAKHRRHKDGSEKMTTEETETQGETSNPMDNQQENKEKILRVMTGALSVLSYPPVFS
jgi:hypothetical protein